MKRAKAFLLLLTLPLLGWQSFYNESPTFAQMWNQAGQVSRTGKETHFDSITENAELLAESWDHLKAKDGWWQERCPNVSEATWSRIEALVERVTDERLFTLMIYLRDLGWADTGSGQFHQLASVPIVERVMRELGYDEQAVGVCAHWTACHSMPAEVYLGEVSPVSGQRLIDDSGDRIAMVALLSLLELNCIRGDLSAVSEANAQVIAQVGEGSLPQIDRVRALARARLVHATTRDEVRADVEQQTDERAEQLRRWIGVQSSEDQLRLGRFLQEVDLHYVAGSFPQMEPEAIGQFLLRSAQVVLPDPRGDLLYRDVINMNQFDAADLAEAPLGIDERWQWVVWRGEDGRH